MKLRTRLVCIALVPLLALLPVRVSLADMLPAVSDRQAVAAFLDRAEVRGQLSALGVDRTEVDRRLNALTDEELKNLSDKLQTAPAGGNAGTGLVLFLLLVLIGFIYCAATLGVSGKDKPSACFFPG